MQSDELRINGRKEDNSGFDPIMVFQRLGAGGAGGNVGFWTGDQFGAGQGVIAIANAIVAQRSILVAAASSMSRWSAEVPRLRENGDDDRASLPLPPREDGGVSRTG